MHNIWFSMIDQCRLGGNSILLLISILIFVVVSILYMFYGRKNVFSCSVAYSVSFILLIIVLISSAVSEVAVPDVINSYQIYNISFSSDYANNKELFVNIDGSSKVLLGNKESTVLDESNYYKVCEMGYSFKPFSIINSLNGISHSYSELHLDYNHFIQ